MRLPALLLALAALSFAHLELLKPQGLRSRYNTFTTSIDYDMKNPLSSAGTDYPCKGHLSILNTPQGQSVASWPAGSQQSFTIEGGTRHNGGSCQATISTDGGNTFKVVQSYVGKCPLKDTWGFKVPGDTPAGPALFAWVWYNYSGNREAYMNCASVTITGGGGRESVSFNSRPDIFRANTGNGCKTVENADVVFPNPGPDVVVDPGAKQVPPVGSCGPSGPSGGGVVVPPSTPGGGGSNGGGAASGPVDIPSTGGGGGNAGIAPPVEHISGLPPSADGVCGGQFSCINSHLGSCCNAQDRCGTADEDCGAGCQGLYGRCTDSTGNPNTRKMGGGGNEANVELKWRVFWLVVVALWMLWW